MLQNKLSGADVKANPGQDIATGSSLRMKKTGPPDQKVSQADGKESPVSQAAAWPPRHCRHNLMVRLLPWKRSGTARNGAVFAGGFAPPLRLSLPLTNANPCVASVAHFSLKWLVLQNVAQTERRREESDRAGAAKYRSIPPALQAYSTSSHGQGYRFAVRIRTGSGRRSRRMCNTNLDHGRVRVSARLVIVSSIHVDAVG